jgi:DnaK suppressor protein
MVGEKIKKNLSSKSHGKVARKISRGGKTKGRQQRKAKGVETTKKDKTPQKGKAIQKVKTRKKVKVPKKVKIPKKVKVAKKVKASMKVKVPKKVKAPKKTEIQKSVTKVPISKKAEEERKAALRSSLVKKREEIVKEAKSEMSKYIRGETKQLVDTALDNGDWSVVDLSEDISLRQLSTHRETLIKIDEALRKIKEGTYGKCEDCGEDISVERLKVLPFAIYCIDCQEKREQLEGLERERRSIE